MKRRGFLLGASAAAALWWLKPGDRGAPYDDYFRALNDELKHNGPQRPCLVLDLDRLDHNLGVLTKSIRPPKHFRVVAKSLPSIRLLDYIYRKSGTSRLMAFHQPFLNIEARELPYSLILLGKPLPTTSAKRFYDEHIVGRFSPQSQLQWLLDTPARLTEYLELAKGFGTRLRINIEIDVGLHRGGVTGNDMLGEMLRLIEANPKHLEFAGFMGYDPHVVKLPRLLGSREDLFAQVLAAYQGFVEYARREHPKLWRDDLTLNGAGSPTYRLHGSHSLVNDLSVGSGLVKPTDFDLDTLAEHRPALFIATPVLKTSDGVRVPGLESLSGLAAAWNPNLQKSYFLYGGRWMARYESPRGLRDNGVYGHSSNQEMANGSAATALTVDDHVFLRPTQSEALMLQFGPLVVVRNGRIVEHWPVLQG